MRDPQVGRLPALPPAAGLLAGVALAPWIPSWSAAAGLASLAPLAWSFRRKRGAALVLVVSSALCLGALVEHRDREEHAARARSAGLPQEGNGLDGHLVGRILEPPERLADGSRRLYVRGGMEGFGHAPHGARNDPAVAPGPDGIHRRPRPGRSDPRLGPAAPPDRVDDAGYETPFASNHGAGRRGIGQERETRQARRTGRLGPLSLDRRAETLRPRPARPPCRP